VLNQLLQKRFSTIFALKIYMWALKYHQEVKGKDKEGVTSLSEMEDFIL